MPFRSCRLSVLLPLCAGLFLTACGEDEHPTPPVSDATVATAAEAASTPATASPAPQPVKTRIATFQDVLPCADCPGIDTTLTLQRDELGRNSFTLRQIYQDRGNGKAFVTAGTWHLDVEPKSGAGLVRLESGTPGDQRTFAIQPNGSLLMLGDSDQPPVTDLDYSLERIRGDLDIRQQSGARPSVAR